MFSRIAEIDSLVLNLILTRWLFKTGLHLDLEVAKPELVKTWQQYREQNSRFYFNNAWQFLRFPYLSTIVWFSPVTNPLRSHQSFGAMPQVVAVFSEEP